MKAASACRRSSAGRARCRPARSKTASVSGLDWFPTFVAAAGDPNIVDELKAGKQLGDQTYKVHLDGYDQMDLLTGKGPSKRHEIWYFAESRLGGLRLDDFKYRFIDQPEGWPGPKVEINMPILTNIKQDPFERTPITGLLMGAPAYMQRLPGARILALRLRSAEGRGTGADSHRVSADAERGVVQPCGGKRADRSRNRQGTSRRLRRKQSGRLARGARSFDLEMVS